jgi:hypothetical protein
MMLRRACGNRSAISDAKYPCIPISSAHKSAAAPCQYTPQMAESNGPEHWASSVPHIPLNTSPEPPTAMPEFPVEFTINGCPGIPTSVYGPFKMTQ